MQSVRADQGAGDEESCDRREAKLMEEKHHRDRDRENDEQIAEDTVISHVRLSEK
jgi:hypothetical protein